MLNIFLKVKLVAYKFAIDKSFIFISIGCPIWKKHPYILAFEKFNSKNELHSINNRVLLYLVTFDVLMYLVYQIKNCRCLDSSSLVYQKCKGNVMVFDIRHGIKLVIRLWYNWKGPIISLDFIIHQSLQSMCGINIYTSLFPTSPL